MSYSVLVVEDDRVNADVLKRFLSARGFSVTAAESAEDALQLLTAHRFDAILLDNVLPGMTGLQALGEIVARSGAPVLVMTGHADEELKKDALLLGARSFLYKPFDFDLLARTVEETVSGQGPK
ncbi:MAG: response regulator [Elusimicrobia bacterium]|nr:response regulator [Elusimicrobiota bacterium]